MIRVRDLALLTRIQHGYKRFINAVIHEDNSISLGGRIGIDKYFHMTVNELRLGPTLLIYIN